MTNDGKSEPDFKKIDIIIEKASEKIDTVITGGTGADKKI